MKGTRSGERAHRPKAAQRADARSRPLAQRIPWVPLVVLAVGVVLLARNADEAHRVVALLAFVDLSWLALAVALQVGTYVCVGFAYRTLARGLGLRLGIGQGTRMAVVNLFVNAAIPTAGLSGNLFLVRMLDRAGVPPGSGAVVILTERAVYFAALLTFVLATAGREVLRLGGDRGIWAVPALVAFALLLAAGLRALLRHPVGAADRLGRVIRRAPAWLRRRVIAPERLVEDARRIEASGGTRAISPARLAGVFAAECGLLVCDALTIWALLHAVSSGVGPLRPAIAYGMSTLFASVVLVPGALELSLGGLLIAQRIRAVPALAVTALFHALSLWAPMPLGGFFYGRPGTALIRRRGDSTGAPSRGPRNGRGEGPSA